MSPRPTATIDRSAATPRVVFTRRFAAPIEDVWAAVSDSERMSRWIGTWTGDPSTGRISFRMNESEADEGDTVIRACDPPRHWAVTTATEGEPWSFAVTLTEDGNGTRLEFAQELTDPDLLASVGPGWEYYLDRLAADLGGEPIDDVQFDDYYPAMSGYFTELARSGPGG